MTMIHILVKLPTTTNKDYVHIAQCTEEALRLQNSLPTKATQQIQDFLSISIFSFTKYTGWSDCVDWGV